MILGMSISSFTTLHVVISLIGIATGLVVLAGMIQSKRMAVWTEVFLATTVLTTATGFLFPTGGFTPAQGVGILSAAILVLALAARYAFRLAGVWRKVYVIGAVAALYLNSFVGVVQSFQKLEFLNAVAPTQSEPPFAIAQGIVLLAFVVLGGFATKRFQG